MLDLLALTALLALPAPAQPAPSESSFVARAWSIADAVLGDEDSRYYVQFGGITSGAGIGLGPGVRLKNLGGSRLDANALFVMSYRLYMLAEGSLSTSVDRGRGRAGVFGRRKYFPQEDFFGLGLESRREDRVNYAYDENAAGAFLTYSPLRPVTLDGRLEYRHPDIGEGHDNSIPSIEALFSDASTPGLLRQPDFLVATGSIAYQGATPIGHPRQGGHYEASLSRFSGRGNHSYDFARFDVDLRQYVPLVPDRQIVALRAVTSLTAAAGSGEVPFYYMPTVGGGRTLRGFREFRFRDRDTFLLQAEYRWLPMPFVETAVFFDTGTAASRVSALSFDNLRSDYGVGVRFGTDARVFFRVDAAFGSGEGTRVFAKFSGAF